MRAWTFLYFVSEITQFMAIPPEGPSSPELTARVSRWGTLGWVRRARIAATSAALLRELMMPADAGEPTDSEDRRRHRDPAPIG